MPPCCCLLEFNSYLASMSYSLPTAKIQEVRGKHKKACVSRLVAFQSLYFLGNYVIGNRNNYMNNTLSISCIWTIFKVFGIQFSKFINLGKNVNFGQKHTKFCVTGEPFILRLWFLCDY